MDESSSEALNFSNPEQMNKNSTVPEALSSCPMKGLDGHGMNLETTNEALESLSVETKSPAEESFEQLLIPTYNTIHNYNMQSLRRKIIQNQLAYGRECKKQEKVWMNRGLPVDSEVLPTKDAFDMRGLNESLPSTSKRPGVEIKGYGDIVRRNLASLVCQARQNYHRLEKAQSCSLSSYTPKLSPLMAVYRFGMPAIKKLLPPTCCDFEKGENDMRNSRLQTLLRRRELCSRVASHVSLSKLKETPAKKEISEDKGIKDSVEKSLQDWAACREQKTDSGNFEVKSLNEINVDNFTASLTKIVDMSFDDTQEDKRVENQNSDYKNNQQSFLCSPVQKLQQEQYTSWGPETNWETDFHFPQTRVPLNSPDKKGGNLDDFRLCLEARLQHLKMREKRVMEMHLMREQSRARTLNSNRVELSGDMDESESYPLNSALGCINSRCNSLHSPEIEDIRREVFHDIVTSARKQKLLHLQESAKKYRSLRYHLSGIMKSDKVIAD